MRHDVKTFGQRAEPAPTTRTTTAAAAAAAATPTNPPPRLYTMPAARRLELLAVARNQAYERDR